MNRFVLVALAAASLAAANTASAAPAFPEENDRISVHFGDLNLAKPAHARILVSRIRIAAKELCGPDVSGDVGRGIDRAKCIRDVQDRAIQSVNRPAVTAAYLGRPEPDQIAQAGPTR